MHTLLETSLYVYTLKCESSLSAPVQETRGKKQCVE